MPDKRGFLFNMEPIYISELIESDNHEEVVKIASHVTVLQDTENLQIDTEQKFFLQVYKNTKDLSIMSRLRLCVRVLRGQPTLTHNVILSRKGGLTLLNFLRDNIT